MKFKQFLFSLLLALIAGVVAITPALAFPPLPSSFYGQIKVNGQNVPEGTLVRALIAGNAYSTARTLMYQDSSVFSLNVPGDESDTNAVEGGKEGDTIQFEVGGVIAKQTGVWHSGTNVKLDLDVNSSGPLATPPPAPPAVPTQTAISVAVAITPTPVAASNGPAAGDSSTTGVVIVVVAVVAVVGGAAWMMRRRKK